MHLLRLFQGSEIAEEFIVGFGDEVFERGIVALSGKADVRKMRVDTFVLRGFLKAHA